VGSSAIDVCRRPELESLMVGQEGCLIASWMLNEWEPQTYLSETMMSRHHEEWCSSEVNII
jgi:hypothetical protein